MREQRSFAAADAATDRTTLETNCGIVMKKVDSGIPSERI
jgi:hypothetical protein